MSTFKCKMCGGSLEVQAGATVIECEYCGITQTLPKLNDDKRVNLYDRANHFRRNNEFDKASAIYEQILNEDGTDAEAYWSLVLCRYGIEYVEDPISHKRVPTVHRAQYTSIFDDDNYKMALEYADAYQKSIYEDEAKAINEIQRGILAISQKEEPFDIFICYKETDDAGRRTRDSVLAQELYYQLTEEGFKVFFARITLEDKLGSAYEPYIFAALHSSKVMVVIGTRPDYFNAIWVKNEWSRYLALIKGGAKKTLIPAYRDMDPYDLPQEFSHLQAQDMSKLGFMQDLIRGINKIVKSPSTRPAPEPQPTATGNYATGANPATRPMLKRMIMFLEDGEWTTADEYCERVLDTDPECSMAYIGKIMAKSQINKVDDLHKANFAAPDISKLYDKACKFASPEEYETYEAQYNIYREKKREQAKPHETPASPSKSTARSPVNPPSYKITAAPKPQAPITTPTQQMLLTKLQKRFKTQLIIGFICLVLYWPIAVVLFICAGVTKGKINAVKAGKPTKDNGCYVATCVYGSYDCPEVWTLRRYRDGRLASTWYGRLFILIYYAISPTIVRLFGKTGWFQKMWRGRLDRMVKKLQGEGVESTPYEDKSWI